MEDILFDLFIVAMLIAAALVFVLLLFVSAPYGQHIRDKWGPNINNKAGWVIMELPTVVIYFILWIIGERPFEVISIVFLSIWMLHYCQRTFIFPLLIRGKDPMPVTIMLFGFTFNGMNTYLQARWINSLAPSDFYSINWLFTPQFLGGLAIFLAGYVINLHSDRIIRNLRKPGETDYKVPYGGMFEYVSCPNYLGEITEWLGWMILTWSFSGLVFVVWTFANLAPRARTHHRWYKEKFEDYPKKRKRLIPFIW